MINGVLRQTSIVERHESFDAEKSINSGIKELDWLLDNIEVKLFKGCELEGCTNLFIEKEEEDKTASKKWCSTRHKHTGQKRNQRENKS